ncbi:hypothetical protein OROMI_029413 [Orobanche minor]
MTKKGFDGVETDGALDNLFKIRLPASVDAVTLPEHVFSFNGSAAQIFQQSVGQRRLIFRNLHRMFHRTLQPQ